MKTHQRLWLAFIVSTSVLLAANQTSSGPQISVNIVGEVYAPNYTAPTPTTPAYYVLHDAGFVERGDPVGNDNPPPATEVMSTLAHYLPSANFVPASAAHAPTLLLISQWGVLREDNQEIAPSFEIKKSLRARIRLVATPEIAQHIERELTDRLYRSASRANIPLPDMLSNLEQNTLDTAQDNHYFVIVTAYDYAAAKQKQIVPVWRLKLSTYDRGTSMPEALPALIRNGRTYFGQSTPEPINEKMPLHPQTEVRLDDLKFSADVPPAPAPAEISADTLDSIQHSESTDLSGAKAKPAEEHPES